jgi:alpha-beta hydrolase superfamily lysophospholipase
VLYIHGFHDYFFQTELADWYVDRGFTFYALDLRKYGRSIRPWHTANFCYSLAEYAEEIDLAVSVIKSRDSHDTLLINAHSAGGLTAALWCHARRHAGLADALVLNSPFLALNAPAPVRALAAGISGTLGRGPRRRPDGRARPPAAIRPRSLGLYPRSLHRDHYGEWDFDDRWKPLDPWPIHRAWLAAVLRGQGQLRRGLDISCPVLVLCSATSSRPRRWDEMLHRSDAVLDAAHIAALAPRLGRRVTCVRIEGAMHDVVLSARPVRKEVYDELGRWLGAYLSGQVRDRLL